jgi:hypothetical protein
MKYPGSMFSDRHYPQDCSDAVQALYAQAELLTDTDLHDLYWALGHLRVTRATIPHGELAERFMAAVDVPPWGEFPHAGSNPALSVPQIA